MNNETPSRHSPNAEHSRGIQLALDAYNQGVSDAKKAISHTIKEMALYFDKWECYSGKYSSSFTRESVDPEMLGQIITEIEVEPSVALTAQQSDVNQELLKALKHCRDKIVDGAASWSYDIDMIESVIARAEQKGQSHE